MTFPTNHGLWQSLFNLQRVTHWHENTSFNPQVLGYPRHSLWSAFTTLWLLQSADCSPRDASYITYDGIWQLVKLLRPASVSIPL